MSQEGVNQAQACDVILEDAVPDLDGVGQAALDIKVRVEMDPDMEFLRMKETGDYYPISFRQDNLGIHRNPTTYRDGRIVVINEKEQADEARFADMWMNNIRQQQRLRIAL